MMLCFLSALAHSPLDRNNSWIGFDCPGNSKVRCHICADPHGVYICLTSELDNLDPVPVNCSHIISKVTLFAPMILLIRSWIKQKQGQLCCGADGVSEHTTAHSSRSLQRVPGCMWGYGPGGAHGAWGAQCEVLPWTQSTALILAVYN